MGGNAVDGASPINQENSMATIEALYQELLPSLGLSESDVASLGSTGKKAPKTQSGDIDIAIPASKMMQFQNAETRSESMDKIVDAIKSKGYAFRDMRSIDIISVGFPIVNVDGLQSGQTVQVDLMIVDSVEYAAWSFYSPSYLESKLKGLYRNEINFAVAKYAGLYVTKTDRETNVPTEWNRLWFNLSKGLEKGTQTVISAKTGKITKTPRVIEKSVVTNDADEVVAKLYGYKYKANDILTFENAYAAIMDADFPYAKYIKDIIKDTANGILSKGYPVPEYLQYEK